MTLKRMDHVGIVVEDLAAAVAFFTELGMELEGEATVEGEWADRLTALDGLRSDIAMLRTPDGNGRVELSVIHSPEATGRAPWEPVSTPGIPRLTFVVDGVDDTVERLRSHGAELVGDTAQYEELLRYAYVRGPAGVIVGLVEYFD
ncbi:VOC family protein [Glycomyces harbinensis]|uniref:Catechol 2,3-dioxygenase n=1 Tax=Glycomyces harbinensis TaxID=58114 RepID=A0A1G6XDC0_9ACTN|nr:VOC family protein [Glycomyces harbinensis]SDD75236.1 Catechol 2,3-dioxygenase [Glycomyces harbinensis]